MFKKAIISSLLVFSAGHALAVPVLASPSSLRLEFYSDSDDKKVKSTVTSDYAIPSNAAGITRGGVSWNSDYVSKTTAAGNELSYTLALPVGSAYAKTTLDVSSDFRTTTHSVTTWSSSNTVQDISVNWGGLGVAHGLEEIDKADRLNLSFSSTVELSNILLTEHYSTYKNTPLSFAISVDGGALQTFSGTFVQVGGHSELSLTQSFVGKTFQLYNTYTGINPTRQFYLGAVTVTAVPEPETYAMLIAGLGLLGAVARRKKKTATSV